MVTAAIILTGAGFLIAVAGVLLMSTWKRTGHLLIVSGSTIAFIGTVLASIAGL